MIRTSVQVRTLRNPLSHSLLAWVLALPAAQAQIQLQINDSAPLNVSTGRIEYTPSTSTLAIPLAGGEPVVLCADLAGTSSASSTGPAVDLINANGVGNYPNFTRFHGFDSMEYLPTGTTVRIRHQGLECYSIGSDTNGTISTIIGPWVPPPPGPAIQIGGNDAGTSISQSINLNSSYSTTLTTVDGAPPLSWSVSTQPSNGTASVDSNGNVTYTPSQDYLGADSFTVTVSDANAASDSLTFNITVVDPNADRIFFTDFEGSITKRAIAKTKLKAESPFLLKATGADIQLAINTCALTNNNGTTTAWPQPNDGLSFCYEFQLTNIGSTDASNVHLREFFPLDSATNPGNGYGVYGDLDEDLNPGAPCLVDDGSTTLNCNDTWATVISSLAAGASVNIQRVRTMHVPDASQPLVIYAAAFLQGDDDTSNNAVRFTVSANNPPAIINEPDGTNDGSYAQNIYTNGTLAFQLDATDPDGDNLVWSISATANQGNVTLNATGTVSYVPNSNSTGTDSFTVQVTDGKGGFDTLRVDLGIIDPSTSGAPVASDSTVTTSEDTKYTFASTDFGYSDASGNSLSAVKIDTLPANGKLTLNGNSVAAGDSIPVADIDNNLLAYTPPANTNGFERFMFSVESSANTTSAASATMTINVTPVNDAPVAANNTVTTNEDAPYTFASADFPFSDVDGDSLSAVVIDTLPANGTLTLNGNNVAAGDSIPVADIGQLAYTPPANANGTGYDSFTFSVVDSSGATNDTSTSATMTIDVTPVNDAPTTSDNTITATAGAGYSFTSTDFPFSDVDTGDSLSAVRIDTLPANGTLTLNGNNVTAGDSIPVTDIGNNLLVYTPPASATSGTGYDSFTFSVVDSTNTASAASATMTIDIQ